MNWTPEQIIALSPDPTVARDAQKLATPSKWTALGSAGPCSWGDCKGSAAAPYQVRIDLTEPAFKCNCPSHKFPCKHALALFLLLAKSPALFAQESPPDWVSQWQQARAARAEKRAKAAENPKPVDITAQGKRAERREARVAAGLQELDLWLRDMIRHGLAAVQNQPYPFWEQAAARLVDAQAPGLANRLRDMAGIPASGQGWPDRLLEQLGLLSLLVDSIQGIDHVPTALQDSLWELIGWNTNKEALEAKPGIRDSWWIVGQRFDKDENLLIRRSWLQRAGDGTSYALILEFAYPSQVTWLSLSPGTVIDAELCFYPGAEAYRAILKDRPAVADRPFDPAGRTIDAAIRAFGTALAANPWIDTFPVALGAVTPLQADDGWFLSDSDGYSLPIHPHFNSPWELLALSGGHPLGLFATWNGQYLLPFSAWSEGSFVNFAGVKADL